MIKKCKPEASDIKTNTFSDISCSFQAEGYPQNLSDLPTLITGDLKRKFTQTKNLEEMA